MKILLGFVNQFYTPQLNLGILDLKNGHFGWIWNQAIDDATCGVRGVNGFVHTGSHWLIGYQSFPTRFLSLGEDFEVISAVEIPDVIQLHSICRVNEMLLCVSTGTEELIQLNADTINPGNGCLTWYQHGNKLLRRDRVHLNSVAYDGRRVLATCFGHKSARTHSDRRHGQLLDLTNRCVIRDGLFQPHSVHIHQGHWWICESGSGRLISESAEIDVGGYVRGVASLDESTLVVASSGRRLQSRSKGTLNVGLATSKNDLRSFVSLVDTNRGAVIDRLDITRYGAEIFEIEKVNHKLPSWVEESNALDIQIDQLERELLRERSNREERRFGPIKASIDRVLHAFGTRFGDNRKE